MQFIIMDLEWNNAYCKKLKGYINEIIAVSYTHLTLPTNREV